MQCIEETCKGDCKRRGRNKEGYNWKCRDCGIEFRVKTKPRDGLMTGPPCAVCGGATANNNRTGVCTLNVSCRKKWYKMHGGKPPGAMAGRENLRRGRYPTGTWELYEDYDDDSCSACGTPLTDQCVAAGHVGELIVDDIAISIAIQGIRKVRLTPTEQSIVARKMIRLGFGTAELIDHMGVNVKTLPKILDNIGYEVIKDPAMSEARNTRTIIARKDRLRK